MISQESIEKFEKIVNYYSLDKKELYDVARSISYLESFGTHPIPLQGLANSGVAYFSDICSSEKAKQLPDTRIMRMLCDTLIVMLLAKKSSLFSNIEHLKVLTLVSESVASVIESSKDYFDVPYIKVGKTMHYKTVEECEQVLDLFYNEVSKKSSNITSDITKFLDYTSNACRVKHDFRGLILSDDFKDEFADAYFVNDIVFRHTDSTVLDSLTSCLVKYILNSGDRLKLSLLISTKTRKLGLSSKFVLKITPEEYKGLRSDSFVLNAMNEAFTFTHAKSLQNMNSIIVLYALLFAGTDEIGNVKNYIGGSGK